MTAFCHRAEEVIMTSSSAGTVHLAVYDTFADWETGHTTAPVSYTHL